MELDAGSLFEMGVILAFVAGIVMVRDDDGSADWWPAMRQALAAFLFQCGLMAFAAAALLKWLPVWAPQELQQMNLAGLRKEYGRLAEFGQQAWWIPATLGALGLGLAALGWVHLRSAQARVLHIALSMSLRVKAVAGLAALFGLCAVAYQHQAQQGARTADLQRQTLAELRLALAEEAARRAALEIAQPLANSLAADLEWPRLSYDCATAGWAIDVPTWGDTRNIPRPHLAKRITARLSDISSNKARLMRDSIAAAGRSDLSESHQLMRLLVETALEQGVIDRLRNRWLDIGNPLLNELLAALVDPVFAQPLREAVIASAVAALRGDATAGSGAQLAQDAVRKLPSAARARLLLAQNRARAALISRAGVALGDPRWTSARKAFLARPMQTVADGAIKFEPLSIQQAWRKLNKEYSALDRLVHSDRQRRQKGEQAFLWLLATPDSETRSAHQFRLAVWGASVAEVAGLPKVSGQLNASAGLRLWASSLNAELSAHVKELAGQEPRSVSGVQDRISENESRGVKKVGQSGGLTHKPTLKR